MSTTPSPVLGQSGVTKQGKIYKQKVDFNIKPLRPGKKIVPGDTLKFVYKIYPDTEPQTSFRSAKVVLLVRPFSTRFPNELSLVETTFQHLAFYRLRPDGARIDSLQYVPGKEGNDWVYALGNLTVKFDSTGKALPVDTLAFEFSYEVEKVPERYSCARLTGGVAAEFRAGNNAFYGEDVANFTVDTQAEINWTVALTRADGMPLLPSDSLNTQDSVRITITYSNFGNVKDSSTFRIQLPGKGDPNEYNDWSFRIVPPLPATILAGDPSRESGNVIKISDRNVPLDASNRKIELIVKFDVCALQDSTPAFVFILNSPCDSSAQIAEIITKPVNIRLSNLLAVQANFSPYNVSPGGIIDYTITVSNVDKQLTLDSVLVTVNLEAGIKEIRQANPAPRTQTTDNRLLTWLVSIPPQSRITITFQAVVRDDFYPVVINNRNEACSRGHFFKTTVEVESLQGKCPEGNFEDNVVELFPQIAPLGDLLRVNVDVIDTQSLGTILPGDILQFVVRYRNVNSFVSTGPFMLSDTLPSRQFVSAPFDIAISSPGAVPVLTGNVINVLNLILPPAQVDSLVFKVRVRGDTLLCEANTLRNIAALIYAGLDCDLTNNIAGRILTKAAAQTELSLKIDLARTDAIPGETVELMINYSNANSSSIPIKNINITNILDDGMELILPTEPPLSSQVGQILRWENLPELAPGRTGTIRLRVKLNALEPCRPDTLSSKAEISSFPVTCNPFPAPAFASIRLAGTDDQLALRYATFPSPASLLNAGNQDEIEYKLTIKNNSQFAAQNLTVTDTPPAPAKFNVTSISPGGDANAAPGKIVWKIPQIAAGDSATVSFKGKVIDRLYCAPDSLANQFVFQGGLACSRDSARSVHGIIQTPVANQPKLWYVAPFSLQDANNNGRVESTEPLKLCITYENRETFNITQITFKTDSLFAFVGAQRVAMRSSANNPNSISGNNGGQRFCFEFNAPQMSPSDTVLYIDGVLAAAQICRQPLYFPLASAPLAKISIVPNGNALLDHAIVLEDSSGNNKASEGERLTAKITLRHQPNSQFAAEKISLHLNLTIDPATANYILVDPNYISTNINTLVASLPVGRDTVWTVRFRYPSLLSVHKLVTATATFTAKQFINGASIEETSPPRSDNMEIVHDCFAKPRTFIPAVHPNGLKFKPDDDLNVFILDVDGNKIWEGTTRQAWNGHTKDGRPVPPGTYIYVIEDQCKGTIMLLR